MKLYIARGWKMGRSLPCALKGKHNQQEISTFGAVLNGIDRTADIRIKTASTPTRAVGCYMAYWD